MHDLAGIYKTILPKLTVASLVWSCSLNTMQYHQLERKYFLLKCPGFHFQKSGHTVLDLSDAFEEKNKVSVKKTTLLSVDLFSQQHREA